MCETLINPPGIPQPIGGCGTMRWTTIKVPKELHTQLKTLADSKNMAMWELIAVMLSHYHEKTKDGKQYRNIDHLDKISYYIMKLSYSVSALKLNPTKENLEWTRKTIDQIATRLELDLGDLRKAAESYYRRRDKEALIVLNMAWKSAIKRLILLLT